MKVGIVSQWRNQGQATLSRHLRDAVSALGHDSFVLARPTRDGHVIERGILRNDVWDQANVEEASNHDIPAGEYLAWAKRHGIEAAFFNQNYQFDEIEGLRAAGVRTIGYFVWESFRAKDLPPARRAYDVIYSLNRCTRDRYSRLGYDSPLVPWGCHPELLPFAGTPAREGGVWCFFPGGLQGRRKPLRAVVQAFRRTTNPELRLLLKGQGEFRRTEAAALDIGEDARIVWIVDDVDQDAYYRMFASCHVCVGVSRWEGTGLHFFEATAFGQPMITNDAPPMNETFRDGDNARLVRSHVVGATRTGVPSIDPDVGDLAKAFDELADPARRETLSAGAARQRDRMRWEKTVHAVEALLHGRMP